MVIYKCSYKFCFDKKNNFLKKYCYTKLYSSENHKFNTCVSPTYRHQAHKIGEEDLVAALLAIADR